MTKQIRLHMILLLFLVLPAAHAQQKELRKAAL